MDSREPVSVVMVAFNEAQTIEAEIRRIHKAIVAEIAGSELIVAEDGSTDGTSEILARLAVKLGFTHLTGKVRKGYIRALLDAFLLAKNPFVFFSDTGAKHNPDEFWKLYALRKEYDLIVGYKYHRNDQKYRQFLTWAYNAVLRAYFHIDGVRDADSGFRLYNRAAIQHLTSKPLTFRNLVGSEMVIRIIHAGLRYHEVPVSYEGREGVSRGLPLGKIPKVAFQSFGAMARLKAELEAQKSPVGSALQADPK